MRSTLVVVVAIVALHAVLFQGLLVSLSTAQEEAVLHLPVQGHGGVGEGKKPWECCDTCMCTRSLPPQCRCLDKRKWSCYPNCQHCKQLPVKIYPPLFQCMDWISDFCGHPCTPQGLDNK